MSSIIIVYDENDDKYMNLRKMVAEAFSDREFKVEEFCVNANARRNEAALFFQDVRADWICTLDMAGFWLGTLLETFLYNILTAKQLHIVIQEERLDCYRGKEFALNLFFAVPGDPGEWKEKYSHILNIDGYPPFETDEKHMILDSESNREIIKLMIDGFFRNMGEE